MRLHIVFSSIVLSVFALLFILPLFIPSTTVFASGNAADSCSYVQWYPPGGTAAIYPNPPVAIPYGEKVSAAISTSCSGGGTFSFIYYGPTGTSAPQVVFSGAFSCPCSEYVLFPLTVLPVGLYVFTGSFPNAPTVTGRLQITSIFVTPQFPMGSILAVVAPLSAFGLFIISKRLSMIRR